MYLLVIKLVIHIVMTSMVGIAQASLVGLMGALVSLVRHSTWGTGDWGENYKVAIRHTACRCSARLYNWHQWTERHDGDANPSTACDECPAGTYSDLAAATQCAWLRRRRRWRRCGG